MNKMSANSSNSPGNSNDHPLSFDFPRIDYNEFEQVLSDCVEDPFSESPYQVSFFNKSGTYRPSWYQLHQIFKHVSQWDVNHLNEMFLDETNIRLIIDIDKRKSYNGTIQSLENSIRQHITYIANDSIIFQELD